MSYGVNAPSGLVPSQYLNGALWTGQVSEYLIASGLAQSIYTYDPVIPDGNGGITQATAGVGDPIVGSFMGVKYIDTSGIAQFSPKWVAGTLTQGGVPATAFVVDDPNVLFDMQVATAGGGLHDAPSITYALLCGKNANLAVAGGTTYNPIGGVTPLPNPAQGTPLGGRSVWYISSASIGAGAPTSQIKLVRLTPVPGNNFGTIFNNALCLINNHIYKGGTGTDGI